MRRRRREEPTPMVPLSESIRVGPKALPRAGHGARERRRVPPGESACGRRGALTWFRLGSTRMDTGSGALSAQAAGSAAQAEPGGVSGLGRDAMWMAHARARARAHARARASTHVHAHAPSSFFCGCEGQALSGGNNERGAARTHARTHANARKCTHTSRCGCGGVAGHCRVETRGGGDRRRTAARGRPTIRVCPCGRVGASGHPAAARLAGVARQLIARRPRRNAPPDEGGRIRRLPTRIDFGRQCASPLRSSHVSTVFISWCKASSHRRRAAAAAPALRRTRWCFRGPGAPF